MMEKEEEGEEEEGVAQCSGVSLGKKGDGRGGRDHPQLLSHPRHPSIAAASAAGPDGAL